MLGYMGLVSGQRLERTINSGWKFNKADNPAFAQPGFNDLGWETVNIPHCWNAKDALETNDYYRGAGWYRKHLYDTVKEGKRYFLRFEGAFAVTDIYVNGRNAGTHKGGYTAFSFDITSYLKAGCNNEIAVRVDNSTKYQDTLPPYSADFTMWGGLYRDVYLVETNGIHFRMDNNGSKGIFFDIPVVDDKSAQVVIRGEITNDLPGKGKFKVVGLLQDWAGESIQSFSSPLKIDKGINSAAFRLTTKIKAPHLWSPDHPYLYQVKVSIINASNEKVLDEWSDHLGVRWFSVDTIHGFMLNGKPLKLLGVNRHQDFPGIGSALTNDMHRRDAHLIKEMGANFTRIAHYPQDPAFLDACDEEGILAWEEIPIVNYVPDNPVFAENSKLNLREMILQHYNHPSVVMWGYMNEILLQADLGEKDSLQKQQIEARTVALAKDLENIIHQEDPARLSTMAWHHSQIYNRSGMGDVPHIIGWNMYVGTSKDGFADFGKQMDEDHAKYPDRPIFISEYGIGSDKRVHTLHPSGYDYSIEYQQLFHESYFPQIVSRKYIIGSTVWNFIDFGSVFRQESIPHINNKGLVYANREPKDVYYYYKSMFCPDPVIHIASRDWNERKGTPVCETDGFVNQPVKIYTNLSKVELFLNGQSLGTQFSSNRNAVYEVPFVNGGNVLVAKSAIADSAAMDAMTVHFEVQPYDLRKGGNGIEIGVNAGSNCFYTDPQSHFIYEPDQPYQRKGSWGYMDDTTSQIKSSMVGINSNILATSQGPLFQSMREGVNTYRFDVPPGTYEVTLSFATPVSREDAIVNNVSGNAGRTFSQRSFNVSINGVAVLQDLDLTAVYGSLTAVERTFKITSVNGEGIVVKFIPVRGKTIISALKVRKMN
jgi:beta-galactosidase